MTNAGMEQAMGFLANTFKTFTAYMRSQQTPLIRILHLAIFLLVISQVIVSNFIEITKSGEIGDKPVELYATWLHIGTGLVLLPLALVFFFVVWNRRGFKYFFPYLAGNLAPLKSDVRQLTRFQLPEPTDGGIAAIIQGLGFGALFLVLISGLGWFVAWNLNLPWSHDAKEIHEFLTGILEAYLIGHGSMGLLHIYFGPKLQASNT